MVFSSTLQPPLLWPNTRLVNGDAAGSVVSGSLATTATAASGVGGYPIGQGSLAANANYTLSFTGNTLSVTGLPSGAIEKVEDALTSLGKLLNDANKPDEAMLCLRKSVEMAPGFALGHWNLSLALLGAGDFAQGWREYEWRWHWDRFPEPRRGLMRLRFAPPKRSR